MRSPLPQEDGKLAAQRDWVLSDPATGEVLGRATSTWVMINMQARRHPVEAGVQARCCSCWWQRVLLVGQVLVEAAAGLPSAG